MKEIVFLLEEESAKVLIQSILVRFNLNNYPIRFIVFEGKQDMDKQILRKLRGYRNQDAYFIILRDQDSAECLTVKENLKKKCVEAKIVNFIIRIACRELESWYLADLQAIEKAFSKSGLANIQEQKKFRNPDYLESPSHELKKIVPEYSKVNGSRLIANFLDMDNNRSKSFYHFINSIKTINAVFCEAEN